MNTLNTDAAIQFLKVLSRVAPHATLSDAMSLLNLAETVGNPSLSTNSKTTQDVIHTRPTFSAYGTWWDGIFFPHAADEYMQDGKIISAIKEVRESELNPRENFGLKRIKDTVEARARYMGWL